MAEGWVSIHRKIFETAGYFSEPFCRNMAWIDLILLANYKPGIIRKRGIQISLKRGDIGLGQETLAERWKWSRGKVIRFLTELEKDEKIIQQKNNILGCISIVNYEQYQQDGTTDSTTDGQQTVQQTDSKQYKTNNNNKVNKENKENKEREEPQAGKSEDFIRFEDWISRNAPDVARMKQPFTEDQFRKIKELHPPEKIVDILKSMHNSISLTKKYKSAYLTACNWLKRETYGTSKTQFVVSNGNGKHVTGTQTRFDALANWGRG